MFRIDRRFVKLAAAKANKPKPPEEKEAEVEADAEGEYPDAEASAEDLARVYMSAAEREMEERVREVMSEAHRKAIKKIEEAEKQAAMLAEEAQTRGYDEGFEKGEREGRRIYEEKLASKLSEDKEAFNALLDEITWEHERLKNDMEADTVALAIEIVRKIINPAEEEIGTVFISQIKNALRQMSSDNKFVIRVAPSEYERLFSTGAAEIELDSGVTITATVLRDVSLEDFDLIIDTEDVTVNAGINSQLKHVEIAFERANQYEPE